jgi:hypothetical protein
MNQLICEREDQTAAAIRSGTLDRDIALHAQQCPACSEILMVGEFLREESRLSDKEQFALPNPGQVWKKAHHRSYQKAVRLALRPIRFMKIVAVIAFLCAPWLRSLLPTGTELFGPWNSNLNLNFDVISRIWPATGTQAVILLGFGAATIFLSLSSWYMVRQE